MSVNPFEQAEFVVINNENYYVAATPEERAFGVAVFIHFSEKNLTLG